MDFKNYTQHQYIWDNNNQGTSSHKLLKSIATYPIFK